MVHKSNVLSARDEIKKIPNIGGSYGARIALLLKDLKLVENTDELLLGPGSIKVLRWMYFSEASCPPKESQLVAVCDRLHSEVQDLIENNEILENALCEFHKYCTKALPNYKTKK